MRTLSKQMYMVKLMRNYSKFQVARIADSLGS